MQTSSQVHVPKVVDMFAPTLHALNSLGGSASNEEIDDKVADLMGLSPEVRSYVHNDGPLPKVNYRCAWARSWLKNAGLVTNSTRGVWTLVQAGRDQLARGDDASTTRFVTQTNYSNRRKAVGAANSVVDTPSLPVETAGDDDDQPPTEPGVLDASANGNWREHLLRRVGSMHPSAFERLCQRLLREAGFTKVEVTGQSSDGGIDGTGVLRMNLLSFVVIFQCKRWQGSVGSSVVRDFRGAMVGRADKGLIITTSAFTAEARKEATRDGAPAIDLVDGETLCDLLKEHRLGVSVRMVEEVVVDGAAIAAF